MTASNEDMLEQQLSARLHDELSGIDAPRDLAATLRRRHNRRTWGVRIAAGIPVIAAVAVAASLTLASPGAAPVAGPSSDQGTPRMLDVSYVSARTAEALGNLNDYYQRSHEVRNDGTVVDFRADAATGRQRTDEYDARGTRLYSMLETGTGKQNGLVVDYANHSWWTDSFARPQVSPGSDTTKIIVGPIYDPAVIKDAEATGTLQLVGPETLNGHNTLHLRWSTIPGFTLDLWVDGTTYLPFRHTAAGAKGSSTVDYSWLARTPANLAELDLTAPAGYTHGAPENPIK